MTRFRCIPFIFLYAVCLQLLAPAGHARQYQLKGFMGVQGGESFTYKLELHDSTDQILSGYAYTYLQEKNDVKAAVIVYIDRDQKRLSLKETQILHNNHFSSKALICLVEAELLYKATEKVLNGALKTHTSGNDATCSPGSISFLNAAEIGSLFNPVVAADEPQETQQVSSRPNRRIVVDSTLPVPATPEPARAAASTPRITEGKDHTYTWHAQEVILEIWDENTVDNDRISILYNGETVLDNYSLVKDKKKLVLALGGNDLNIIAIKANNEGYDPPNTATLLLTDGITQHKIVAHNIAGKTALIKIRKAK